MDLSTMTYEVRDRVAHVRFARPEGANAVNPAMAKDLRAVLQAIEFDDDVRSVSVTAEGKVFSAGGDIKFFSEAGASVAQATSDMLVDYHASIYKMNSIPKPFVVGVRGAAGAAGLALMAAFDLAVCGESAKFTMAYTKLGVTPDGGSSYFLARHIGVRRMMDLTLTNRVLSAAEAEAWGLVNRVVADDDVDAATAELAQQLADGATWATGHAKRLIYHGFDASLPAAGEHEGLLITESMRRHDGQEGIAAFVAKRPPEFTGD